VTVTRETAAQPSLSRYNLTWPRQCKRAISAQHREVKSLGRRLILGAELEAAWRHGVDACRMAGFFTPNHVVETAKRILGYS
jgi:hypothetical protein